MRLPLPLLRSPPLLGPFLRPPLQPLKRPLPRMDILDTPLLLHLPSIHLLLRTSLLLLHRLAEPDPALAAGWRREILLLLPLLPLLPLLQLIPVPLPALGHGTSLLAAHRGLELAPHAERLRRDRGSRGADRDRIVRVLFARQRPRRAKGNWVPRSGMEVARIKPRRGRRLLGL